MREVFRQQVVLQLETLRRAARVAGLGYDARDVVDRLIDGQRQKFEEELAKLPPQTPLSPEAFDAACGVVDVLPAIRAAVNDDKRYLRLVERWYAMLSPQQPTVPGLEPLPPRRR